MRKFSLTLIYFNSIILALNNAEVKTHTSDKTNENMHKPSVIQQLGSPIHADDNTVGAIKKRGSTLVPPSRSQGMKPKYLKEV